MYTGNGIQARGGTTCGSVETSPRSHRPGGRGTEKYGRRTHACRYILLCDLISYQNYSTERESESNLGREGEAGREEPEHILIQIL